MPVRDKLIEARNAAGLTQGEVAALLKCSRNHISMIEQGKRDVTLKKAAQFAKIYKLPITELFQDELN